MPDGNRNQIISVATDKDQAGVLFNEVASHLAKCDYFRQYQANNTQSQVNFRTPHDIDKYGAVAIEPGTQTAMDGDEVVTVTGLIEKPPVDEAPSSLAIIGRYVLSPEVFGVLRDTAPGRGGEIQLTDALATLVERGEPLHGVVFSGRRYDTGDRLDYLKAVIQLASEREDLGPPLRSWLHEFVATLPSEGASSS